MIYRASTIAASAFAFALGLGCSGKLRVGDAKSSAGAGSGGQAAGGDGSGAGGAPTSAGTSAFGGAGGSPAGARGGGSSLAQGGSPAQGGSAHAGNDSSTPTSGQGSAGTPMFPPILEPDEIPTELPEELRGATPAEPSVGSAEECPTGPVIPNGRCDVYATVCGYHFDIQGTSGYQECACTKSSVHDAYVWTCYNNSSGATCPAKFPENGSDCFGYYGQACDYPVQRYCECSAATKIWDCGVPVEPTPYLDPPAMPDEDRPIDELSDADRAAWCAWYEVAVSGGPGFPPREDVPVDDAGYTYHGGCAYGRFGSACGIAVVPVSAAQCAANLALSECKAPIARLTDCLASYFRGCEPSPQGCRPYLDEPGCEGTIVRALTTPFPQQSTPCDIRVR